MRSARSLRSVRILRLLRCVGVLGLLRFLTLGRSVAILNLLGSVWVLRTVKLLIHSLKLLLHRLMHNLNLLLTVSILLLGLLHNHLLAVNLLLWLAVKLLLWLAIKLLLLLLLNNVRWLSQETWALLLLWLHVLYLLLGLNDHLLAELVVGNLRNLLLRLDVLDNWLLISTDTTAKLTTHASAAAHASTTEKIRESALGLLGLESAVNEG